MTAENFEANDPDPEQQAPDVEAPPTGNPIVDEVLASLEALDGLPAGEHVAVFESAHDRLRAALTAAGESGQD